MNRAVVGGLSRTTLVISRFGSVDEDVVFVWLSGMGGLLIGNRACKYFELRS